MKVKKGVLAIKGEQLTETEPITILIPITDNRTDLFINWG